MLISLPRCVRRYSGAPRRRPILDGIMKNVLPVTILLLLVLPAAAQEGELRVWNSSPHDAALFEVEGLGSTPIRIEPGQELVFHHPEMMVSLAGPSLVHAAWRGADGAWTEAMRPEVHASSARRRAVRSALPAPTRVRAGDTATFTGSHRVSGVATIVDSRTIRITNYRHDGTAPGLDMRLGLSTGSRRNFTVARITGNQPFAGETLEVTIPDGMDLNSFDTFTVWCYVFNVIIADAPFVR